MKWRMNLKIELTQIKNLHLKRIIKNFLNGENFQKYKKVPAGKAWHHAYIGGLLEHTLRNC